MTGRAASIYYATLPAKVRCCTIVERTIRRSRGRRVLGSSAAEEIARFRDRSVALRPIPIRMEITWTGPPVEIVFPTKFLA